MPEYSGSLPPVELSPWLWLVPMLPLVAAAVCAFWRDDRARGVALAAAAGAGVLLALPLADLVSQRRIQIAAPWTLVRIGSLDLALGLQLDAAGAVVCIAALAASLAVLARKPARDLAVTSLALGAVLLVALADDFVLAAFGWQGLALAAYLLRARIAPIGRLALAALLGGAIVLAWGLGGVWTASGGLVPDFHPRLVAVQESAAPPARPKPGEIPRAGHGELTVTALPGSTLTLGGAELCLVDDGGRRGGLGTASRPCRMRAVTPFVRLPVPAAIHDVIVSTGPGTFDLEVDKVRVSREQETRIVLTGPTLAFREIENQLQIRDLSGTAALRAALSKKQLWGLPLAALVAALLLFAAVARALGSGPSGSVLVAAFGAGSAALLVARVSGLLTLAPKLVSVGAALAALLAAYAALRAVFEKRRSNLVTLAVLAQVLLAIAGAAVGASGAAAVQLAVMAVAAVPLAASESRRTLFVAAIAATAAPVPALGTFWSRDVILWSLFGASQGVIVPGWVSCALGLVASGAASLALWRMVLSQRTKDQEAAPALFACALLALALGLALAPAGNPADVLPGAWLFGALPDTPPVDRSLRYGALLLAFAVPFGGWMLARRRYRPPGETVLGKDVALASVVARLEQLGGALIRVDRAVESVTRGRGSR